jgi:hypothetical protein
MPREYRGFQIVNVQRGANIVLCLVLVVVLALCVGIASTVARHQAVSASNRAMISEWWGGYSEGYAAWVETYGEVGVAWGERGGR